MGARWDKVLDFWFGEVDEHGFARPEQAQKWFKKDPEFDQSIRDQFTKDYEALVSGDSDAWLETPRGRLAAIIVLDQFSRNMFRGDPKTYAADPLALRWTLDGLEAGADRALSFQQRTFFYMPLMHSEDLAMQDKCVEVFERLVEDAPEAEKDRFRGNLGFAQKHRDIVKKWGRFPHRNEILSRTSTPEEQAFLEQPGSSF